MGVLPDDKHKAEKTYGQKDRERPETAPLETETARRRRYGITGDTCTLQNSRPGRLD